jgi:hypothetical protein
MNDRRRRIEALQKEIGHRKLIWFGTRGSDARPLLELSGFRECYSLISPLGALALDAEVSLETLRRFRVDLNRYDVDADTSEEASELHRHLVRACGEPCYLAAYRPSAFLASAYFPRSQLVRYLGMFHQRQAPFEHKPWVETELSDFGVNVIPWRYFGDEDLTLLEETLIHGPLVLRTNKSDGGAGLNLVRNRAELLSRWPAHGDGFLAASPFLEPNVPLNINACVFPDGVALHAPSLQLIGIAPCTGRVFGYCGNDFARIRDLDDEVLDSFETIALGVGEWLRSKGYVGAFGVDAIVHEGRVYLTEVNPRFQGSSAVAARLAANMEISDLFMDHISAFLGLEAPAPRSIRMLAREQEQLAQIVCYNRDAFPVGFGTGEQPIEERDMEVDLLPPPGVEVESEGMIFKALVRGPVTADGHSLLRPYGE